MKKLYAILLTLFVMQNANAIIIDSADNTYLTDTGSGLDWLDLSATSGLTVEGVNAQLGAGGDFDGWRYAFGYELTVLVSNWLGLESPILSSGLSFFANGSLEGLQQMLGGVQRMDESVGFLEPFNFTSGLVENSIVSGHHIATMMVHDNPEIADNYSPFGTFEAFALDSYSFLVRDTGYTSVPEPVSLSLFGLGLVGLAFSRRKTKIATGNSL